MKGSKRKKRMWLLVNVYMFGIRGLLIFTFLDMAQVKKENTFFEEELAMVVVY